MKRKLFLLLCALLTTVGVWADKTSVLTEAGWTQKTDLLTSDDIADNYFIFVEAKAKDMAMSEYDDFLRPSYRTIGNPASETPYIVWELTANGSGFDFRNVEMQSGYPYIPSAGNSWDTHFHSDKSGNTCITMTVSEGKYSLKYNITTDQYLGHWADNADAPYEGESIAGNKSSANATGFYIYAYSKSAYRNLRYNDSATEESPQDVTFLINNANFICRSNSGWTWTGSSGNRQYSAFTVEAWNNNNVKFSQSLTSLKNGKYRLTAQIAVPDDARKNNTSLYAKGATESTAGAVVYSFPGSDQYNSVSNYLKENRENCKTSLDVAVVDGTLEIGIKDVSTGNGWMVFDNFKLYYLGEDLTIYIEAYESALDAAKTLSQTTETMSQEALSALNSAIDTYDEGKVEETKADLIAATTALNTATTNANNSIADYSNLSAAITAATNHTTCFAFTAYTPVFPTSQTSLTSAIAVAQGVYDAHTAASCTSAITALADAVHAAYVSDYNIFADDYDYDYSTLLNPDMTLWTTTNWATLKGNQHWNGKNDQYYYEQTGAEWGSGNWSHSGTETIVLPAGHYVMSIIARSSTDVVSTLSVTVGSAAPLTTSFAKKGDVGLGVTTAGVGSYNPSDTYANGNNGRGWEYRFVSFNVPEDNTSVAISVSASCTPQYNWVSLTNPLLKGDVHPNQILVNQIQSLLPTLEGYEGQIHADTYDTFSDDISNAEAATVETATATLEGYVTALQNDINVASAMLAKMNSIADNKGDLTSMINGTFQTNADGWTGGTRVTWVGTQSWRGGDDAVFYERNSNGTMSYTLANMPSGSYKIVAAARTYDGGKLKAQVAGGEYGTELTGTGAAAPADGTKEINLNGVEMPYSHLGGFTSDASGHNWHWITATGTLAADGNLVINFEATGNSWMAIDDVHLYCTNLDETAYTRTVGDGKGTINANTSAVTVDIILENPNTILRTTGAITTAAGQSMNNDQYNSSRITKLVLYDGYDFTNSGDNYGLDYGATLYREIPADTWCTLMVPFYPTNLDVKKVPASLVDGVLSFEDAPTKDMNDSPMLVKSTEGVTAITGVRNSTYGIGKGTGSYGNGAPMQGVYVNGTVPESGISATNYVVSGNNLYKVDSEVNIKPFRAYFTVAGEEGARLTLRFDDTTVINSIEATEVDSNVLKDGKYLIDNKIVLVKNGVKYSANGQILK